MDDADMHRGGMRLEAVVRGRLLRKLIGHLLQVADQPGGSHHGTDTAMRLA